jgi:PAS domain S-box-containing protein
MALVGLDGSWLRTNAKLCQILGYEEAELLGLRFQDLTHPDDLEASNERVRSIVAGECRSYTHEKRYLRPDGTTVWGMLSVSLVRDAGDAPLYFVAQIENIDDRKRAEAEAGRLLEREREHVEQLRGARRDEGRIRCIGVARAAHAADVDQGVPRVVLDGESGTLNGSSADISQRSTATASDCSASSATSCSSPRRMPDGSSGPRRCRPRRARGRERRDRHALRPRRRDPARANRRRASADSGDGARLAQLLDNLVSNAPSSSRLPAAA